MSAQTRTPRLANSGGMSAASGTGSALSIPRLRGRGRKNLDLSTQGDSGVFSSVRRQATSPARAASHTWLPMGSGAEMPRTERCRPCSLTPVPVSAFVEFFTSDYEFVMCSPEPASKLWLVWTISDAYFLRYTWRLWSISTTRTSTYSSGMSTSSGDTTQGDSSDAVPSGQVRRTRRLAGSPGHDSA
jgi:hypothetical protein